MKTRSLPWLLLFLALVLLGAGGCKTAPESAPRALPTLLPTPAEQLVRMWMEPDTVNAAPGEVFALTIKVDAGDQKLDAAQVSLDFSTSELEVIDLQGSELLTTEILKQFDNTAGTLDYAAGILPPTQPVSGKFILAQVQCRALGETAQAGLSYHIQNPRQTGIFFQGTPVLNMDSLAGARVVIKPNS
jgi:hypothetical protein